MNKKFVKFAGKTLQEKVKKHTNFIVVMENITKKIKTGMNTQK